MKIFVLLLSQKTFFRIKYSATTFIVHKYSFQRVPNQVEKLWKFQGMGGGGMASNPWNGNSRGWGSKAKVPSVGGMDIFWNYTS